MSKVKIFEVLVSADRTWTGAGIEQNGTYKEEMEIKINEWIFENLVPGSPIKMEPFYLNKSFQHGTEKHNSTRMVIYSILLTYIKNKHE